MSNPLSRYIQQVRDQVNSTVSNKIDFQLVNPLTSDTTCDVCEKMLYNAVLGSKCNCQSFADSLFKSCYDCAGSDKAKCKECNAQPSVRIKIELVRSFYHHIPVKCNLCNTICGIGENLSGLLNHYNTECKKACEFCNATVLFSDMTGHEAECSERKIHCPFANVLIQMKSHSSNEIEKESFYCHFAGNRQEMLQHAQETKCDRLFDFFKFGVKSGEKEEMNDDEIDEFNTPENHIEVSSQNISASKKRPRLAYSVVAQPKKAKRFNPSNHPFRLFNGRVPTICNMTNYCLRAIVDKNETNLVLGKSRGEVNQFVFSRLSEKEKQYWNHQVRRNPNEANKDFSRGLTASPFKCPQDRSGCFLR
jgi:hypothetical protein